MKRLFSVGICVLLIMTGCSGSNTLDRVIDLRTQLLNSQGCSFRAEITADYGDELYEFELSCTADDQGNVTFIVEAPESIAGITGTVDTSGGKLTFDDEAVLFETLVDGLISPVTAPWVMLMTLRGGYITSAGEDNGMICTTINDTYKEQALELDIWLDSNVVPVRSEILWQGKRVLSMNVENFVIM